MPTMKIRLPALLAAAAAALLLAATAGAAGSATSSNWSGYAVTGTGFSTVTGSWVQPAATCSAAAEATASAFWVGLGGDSESSSTLEQIGTEADCSGGTVSYSAWYELVPAAAVEIPLHVSAGDSISASVHVGGTRVTVVLRDLTAKTAFSKTLTMASPDTSSAEWIAEAPSVLTPGGTRLLPLTDFGTVTFTNATATSTAGHIGPVSDPAWSATRIRLASSAGGPGRFAAFSGRAADTRAVPSTLRRHGRAFSVAWSEAAAAVAPFEA
jgi:Peptidase A4 family